MSARVWNEEMIEELKRLRRLGHTFGRIARRLGVTRNAAIGKAMRVGLRVRTRSAAARRDEPVAEPEASGPPREVVRAGLCHWIHGDVGGDWRMCGHNSVPGRSWCTHHLARVFESVEAPAAEDEAA